MLEKFIVRPIAGHELNWNHATSYIIYFHKVLIPNSNFSGRIRVNCKNLRSITPYLDDRVWIILKTPPRQSPNLLELNSVPRELIYQGRANRRPSTRNSYKGINAAYLIIPISSSDSKLLEWRIFWLIIEKSSKKKILKKNVIIGLWS